MARPCPNVADSLLFTHEYGDPITIHATRANGQKVGLKVTLAVFEVSDLHKNDSAGEPQFEIQAIVVVKAQTPQRAGAWGRIKQRLRLVNG